MAKGEALNSFTADSQHFYGTTMEPLHDDEILKGPILRRQATKSNLSNAIKADLRTDQLESKITVREEL